MYWWEFVSNYIDLSILTFWPWTENFWTNWYKIYWDRDLSHKYRYDIFRDQQHLLFQSHPCLDQMVISRNSFSPNSLGPNGPNQARARLPFKRKRMGQKCRIICHTIGPGNQFSYNKTITGLSFGQGNAKCQNLSNDILVI